MIEIKVRESIFVRGLPADAIMKFSLDNTFDNPALETLKRLGKWTGNTPAKILLFSITPDRIMTLPRGYLATVMSTLKTMNLDCVLTNLTICPPVTDDWKRLESNKLYDYQEASVQELMQYDYGVVEAPTGSGKTQMLLSLAARLETHTLVIVHTQELLKQSMDRCESWLNAAPGVISSTKIDLRPITFGMVQTLARRDLKALGITSYFGGLILDECHHSPCNTWSAVIQQFPCRFKFGFSATAWRKDKMEFLIWRLIGPIRSKVSRHEVEEAGKIVPATVEPVSTNFFFSISDPSEWGQMVSALVEDVPRNSLIAAEVRCRLRADLNSKALILTDRIQHAETLAALLPDHDPVLLTGSLKAKERQTAMERVRSGARLTIGTVHLLGEGVDCPGWDTLFLVSPFSGGPRVLQALGRVVRASPGKSTACVVDFVDYRVGMLKNAARSRRKLFISG